MPLQATSGVATYDAFGGGAAVAANYIEDVFSTWLYTGTGSAQTITNGIDLAGEGGLVWLKRRSGAEWNVLEDTLRGANQGLSSNSTDASATFANSVTSFNSDGFSLGSNGATNPSGSTLVSWTFREQPKFFDVVTYTGNGSTNDVAHALDSVPGFVVIKKTSTTSNWYTLNRDSSGNYVQGYLNTTGSLPQVWTSANTSNYLTSTTLKINALATITGEDMNASGTTYVAYLFAHNAGGFGRTGTDNVISCGSFTSNSDGSASVTLGYEPQFLLYKRTDATGDWVLLDTMRGFSQSAGAMLRANLSSAEQVVSGDLWNPTATGFIGEPGTFGVSTQNIYIAIRRGPMRTPTTGTSVFAPVATSATAGTSLSVNFPADWVLGKIRNINNADGLVDRLRGFSQGTSTPDPQLRTNSTAAETTGNTPFIYNVNNTTALVANAFSGSSSIYYFMGRAPGFMDVVCYTGNGTTNTIAHNLGVTPEWVIVKVRNQSGYDWLVYRPSLGTGNYIFLNTTAAAATGYTTITSANASNFGFTDAGGGYNNNAWTYVSYLFASVPGVSKVGSYTGTGTTQTINCGFTAGSRFVMIKRTDSTGDWYVWDSARGIVAGNDPYLLLNSTAAEVTSTDYVDTAATGFEISSTAPAAINASGGTFIFLAIA